jgi:DNA-binding FadR family transcriptional regulator
MLQLNTPIEIESLVDRVETCIIDLLHQRKLRTGDKIPKQPELVKALGVSRTVVREALYRLQVMGFIEMKKEGGGVITNPDVFANLSKSMLPSFLSIDTLKELFELRLVLEIGIADLLFSRITTKDIEDLRQIVKQEPISTVDYVFKASYEIRFHSRLGHIAGNKTLQKFQSLLMPVFDYVEKSSLYEKIEKADTFVSHNQLIDILETGTPQEFRNAMRSHLNLHFLKITRRRFS